MFAVQLVVLAIISRVHIISDNGHDGAMILPAEDDHSKPSYRVKRGARLADIPPSPNARVPPLSSFDGPFQLAEYLSLKVRHDPHDIKGLVEVPSDNAKAADKHVWIYEHLRRIPIDVTPLITQLLQLCSRESCPEMKASEWQYLCVAHGGDGTDTCCAIDYITHALDSTTALLSSSSYFPSRLQIPHASLAHFPSLFRRLSRIFSHAFFHHREAFATSEAETSLYARFVALCERYELVSDHLLIIPKDGYENFSQDDDDDHEDHRDDDDEEYDDDDHSRGRDGDDSSMARSHSLGRHPAPFSPGKWVSSPVQPAQKGKPAPAQASESLSPPSTRAQLEFDEEPPMLPKNGRGTLSRGKTPRGSANLWEPEGETEKDASEEPQPNIGMARKESVESVVYVGKDGEERVESVERDEEKEDVKEELKEDRTEETPTEATGPSATAATPTATTAPKVPSPVHPPIPLPEPTLESTPESIPESAPAAPVEEEVPSVPETAASAPTEPPAPSSPVTASAPVQIPTVNRPTSPLKSTSPRPPAAASPGKSTPAPALASPTIPSSPAKIPPSPAKIPASPAKPVPIPMPSAPTSAPTTVDLSVSPKTVLAGDRPLDQDAKDDMLARSPKSELQARSDASPRTVGKKGSKNKRGSPKGKSSTPVGTPSKKGDKDED